MRICVELRMLESELSTWNGRIGESREESSGKVSVSRDLCRLTSCLSVIFLFLLLLQPLQFFSLFFLFYYISY